jgi:hypothetical protein
MQTKRVSVLVAVLKHLAVVGFVIGFSGTLPRHQSAFFPFHCLPSISHGAVVGAWR